MTYFALYQRTANVIVTTHNSTILPCAKCKLNTMRHFRRYIILVEIENVRRAARCHVRALHAHNKAVSDL